MPDEVVYGHQVVSQTCTRTYNTSMDCTYQNDDTETTSGKEQVDPVLDLVDLHVVARRDDTSFVQTTVQLDDNLA